MAEYSKKFIVLDLETTHLDMREGRIMEVAALETEIFFNDKTHRTEAVFGKNYETLVNPEIAPSEAALMLTNIDREALKIAPLWKDMSGIVKEFVADSLIVGHNIGFDLGYMGNQGLKLKNQSMDTLVLAKTLLPTEDSHSLESLAEAFEVPKEGSHRALMDCQSTARVLADILNVFLGFEPSLQTSLRKILEKSEISFKDWILDLPEVHKPPRPRFRGSKTGGSTPADGHDLDFTDKTLYSLPLSFADFPGVLQRLKNKSKRGLIGLSHRSLLATLPETVRLVSPNFAMCTKRYERILESERLPAPLSQILIKLAIFLAQTKSLDLGQIKWSFDETPFLHYFTVDKKLCPKHQCKYPKELKEISDTKFADMGAMFALSEWPLDMTDRLAMLFDLAQIEDQFTEANIETWNLKKIRAVLSRVYPIGSDQASFRERLPEEIETLANELDVFFGVLHLVYLGREGAFSENLVISDAERASTRFQKLFYPAQKLKTKFEGLQKFISDQIEVANDLEEKREHESFASWISEFTNFVNEFFLEPSEKNISWLRFNSSWVDLSSGPRDLKSAWANMSAKYKSVTIADTVLPQISLEYFRRRLGLENFRVQPCPVTDGPQVPVRIFSHALSNSDLTSLLQKLPLRSLLVVPNETKLKECYESLSAAKQIGELFAYKFSGGLAAIKSKLKKTKSEKVILILTMHALQKYWKTLPEFSHLLIMRLPFEAQGSKPTLLGLPEQSAFAETILPRAIGHLHRLISSFLAASGKDKNIYPVPFPKTPQQALGMRDQSSLSTGFNTPTERYGIYLLDPRILKDYDQSFMKYFEEFSDFTISTQTISEFLQTYAEISH